MDDVMIRLKGVRKGYRINSDDGKEKRFLHKRETEEYVVFRDVDLEVRRGEVVALLGRNGCGKSTLLKIISEIIEPDCGTVEVNGKVASILELSMGFHSDLTGRENIFLRSELYGIPRKVVATFADDIVRYSDLGKFIDNPVRTYSSGMRARLAFAIMVNVDADIFLVDEALSTGDMAFASKASEHLGNLVRKGKTVIMTSHNMRTIKGVCTRAVWISEQRIFMDGPADEVCDEYSRSINESLEETEKLANDGSSAAQYRLAGYYRKGIGTETDRERYAFWLKQASDRGHVPAMAEYADLLMSVDPERNLEEALALYKEAADGNNHDARRHYAYLRGNTDSSTKFLLETLRGIAGSGYPEDLCMYGSALYATARTDADRERVFETYMEAAEKGSAEGLYRAGMMLRNGTGTEADTERAVDMLKRSADLGHPKAMTVLGDMYMEGRLVGKDPAEAFGWYLLSARTGNPRSQYQVAVMLSEGIGTEKDESEADVWFRRNAESYLNAARMYAADRMHGTYDDAVALLGPAADSGNNRARLRLARMMSHKDPGSSDRMLEEAAMGQCRDRVPLARSLSGKGSDPERAFTLYRQAADNGDPYAMYAVACMYRDGTGTEEDREMYRYYTRMAAEYGNRDAKAVVRKWDMKAKRKAAKERKR